MAFLGQLREEDGDNGGGRRKYVSVQMCGASA